MTFRQILLPILVLVALNLRLGLALPHQTIRFSFEKVSLFFMPWICVLISIIYESSGAVAGKTGKTSVFPAAAAIFDPCVL